MFQTGCAEQQLDVPLFAELYGYGQFLGRRNRGIHDPLFCRVFSFNDNGERAMIVYTDICSTDDVYAREMRGKLACRFGILPERIAFAATHTHSAPPLSSTDGGGSGVRNMEFQETWKRAVISVAAAAIRDEEPIECAEAGAAVLPCKLGKNRIDPAKNVTDESIRWVRFLRADGSCKVLLHSHGIHGTAMNMEYDRLVSADWPGAVNRIIKERKLADMPLFLLGPCGDQLPYTSCKCTHNDKAADMIGEQYADILRKSIEQGGEKITDLTIRAVLKTVKLPVVKQTAEELLADADNFRKDDCMRHHTFLEEMAMLVRQGKDLTPAHDFQVMKIGEISLFFIPGEYFVEDGKRLMERSRSKFCIAASVSNGNGAYYPSEENMKKYPDVESRHNSHGFGFYEVYCYPYRQHFKYQDHVAEFVAEQLLNLEASL